MSTITISDISKMMAKFDFAMLTTQTDGGQLATRPMSNNGEVDYRGDSYYFSWDTARTVSDIVANNQVTLSFQGSAGLFRRPPLFVAVAGRAKIVRERSEFAAHWTSDLQHWFSEGIDTKGLVMIHLQAHRIHYWDENGGGEIAM